MTIEEMRRRKQELGYTNEMLAEKSGVPLGTIQKIFGGSTRAPRRATIEKLVQRGFLERRGDKKTRHLVATEKGNSLITVMPEQIQSASMTAEWETKLLRVQQGELSAKEFMEEIEAMIADLVRNYKNVRDSEMLMKRKEKHYGRKLE